MENPKEFLLELFNTAVKAAHPAQVLANYLPPDRSGRAIVIGAGKAAASMAKALEEHWEGPLSGLVVTRYEHGLECEHIEVLEAAHPVPDDAGREVAERIMDLVSHLQAGDTVFCLLSGGGSSLLSLPAEGISLSDKQQVNRALLRSGATISEMNCVRKHLSAIKGGRLAKACWPARLHTFAISDVPGDDPSVIASGPTVADPTTSANAIAILRKYQIKAPQSVLDWLNNPASETVKPNDPVLENTQFTLIATPQHALEAAAALVRRRGLTPMVLSDSIEGESREVAKVHGALAIYARHYDQPVTTPCVIISGGETSVTVKGNGRGGRNAEFLLSLANTLKGEPGIYALAADTDGIDGSETNAGCWLTPETWNRAEHLGINAEGCLEDNDGFGFFDALDQLIVTGPTRTNVNDFRAILIL
ncbi:glycerate kinase type-2 family protein [Hahella ganghwensis]|uniref:glycerate kinase type-2 family protein n=1 Tax=Hahella ganghwensis TaxID=286420 RepID=UPI001FE20397|nr:glycerate kinase [Hahella ganghwensis]